MPKGCDSRDFAASAAGAQRGLQSVGRLTHKGVMLLTDYLSQHKLSDAAFGARVGRGSHSINRIKRGKTIPSLVLALAIEDETGGEVTVRDIAAVIDPALAEGTA